MKLWAKLYVGALVLSLFTGCMAQKPLPAPSELIGSWQTDVVQSEWGKVVLELNFQTTSDLVFTMTPVNGGETMMVKGKYQLRRRQLISDSMNKGEPVAIWMEDNHLMVHVPSESPQKFRRKEITFRR